LYPGQDLLHQQYNSDLGSIPDIFSPVMYYRKYCHGCSLALQKAETGLQLFPYLHSMITEAYGIGEHTRAKSFSCLNIEFGAGRIDKIWWILKLRLYFKIKHNLSGIPEALYNLIPHFSDIRDDTLTVDSKSCEITLMDRR